MTEMADAQPLGGELASELLTFLIADVRGYTHFTVQRGDEAAARLAGRFAAVTRQVVESRGGRIIELRGDEALAAFASARQAVRAALDMQTRFAQEATADPDLAIPIGIGLDAGEAIPLEGGYRGGALNLAARLCSLAAPGEVLVSEGLVHLARKIEGLVYIERGREQLKGFDEPVRVIMVVPEAAGPGHATTEDRAERQRLPVGNFLGALPAARIVAREEEVAVLSGAVDEVEAGEGQLLLLTGERGVGKTRLAQEAAVEAGRRAFLVATGRCYESRRGIPFYPFIEALNTLFDLAPPAVRSQAARRWPHLARILPEHVQASPTPATDPSEEQLRLFRAVTGFVAAVSESRPVALLFDDLQWADDPSLELLQDLARHSRAERVLLLGAYRDTDLSTDHRVHRMARDLGRERLVQRVTVRRLPPEGTAALLGETMGKVEVSPELADLVHRRTRGNPFFIEEIVRALGGRYQLVRELGAGGMGRVYQAVDTRDDRPVAIKILFASNEANVDALLRFQQEGALLSTLKHPHIVEVYGTFLEEHISCIIMELLEGRSLRTIMGAGPLDLPLIKSLVMQVAAALAYAHGRSIVHRDIKPDNIMVVGDDHVKVTDFGIARVLGATATFATRTGMGLGTPLYMAPEQLEGRSVDGRTDIYALGAVLYEMVTGRPVFEGTDPMTIALKHVQEAPQPPSEVNAQILPEWEELILTMLAKDPGDRYPTAAALKDALSALPEKPVATSRWRAPPSPRRIRTPTPSPTHEPGSVTPAPRPRPPSMQARGSGTSGDHALLWNLASPSRPLKAGLAALVALTLAFGAWLAFRPSGSSFRPPSSLTAVAGWGAGGGTPPSFVFPAGMAVDRNGTVYVSDRFNDHILKISPDGSLLAQWGSRGSGPGRLSLPDVVLLDRRGTVYVSDSGNNRIQRYSADGKLLGTASLDWLQGQLIGGSFDSHGNLFALTRSNVVSEGRPGGKSATAWGPGGKGRGTFVNPMAVAVDGRDALYVLDQAFPFVLYRLSADGRHATKWSLPAASLGNATIAQVAVDRIGNVYVGVNQTDRVLKLSPSGKVLAQWVLTGPQTPSLQALATGPGRTVLAADSGNQVIDRFSSQGALEARWGAGETARRPFKAPMGVAVDSRDNVYVADTGNNRIVELSPAGVVIHSWSGSKGLPRLSGPQAVLPDGSGNLYVADSRNNRVVKLSSDGESIAPWGAPRSASGTLSQPYALALDGEGHLWVLDAGTPALHELASDGRKLAEWQPGNAPAILFGGVAADSGRLYLTGGASSGVSVYSPDGKKLASWGSLGAGSGQFRSPGGIALDPGGNVYVSDSGNNRIEVSSSDGTFLLSAGTSAQLQSPSGIAVDSHGNVYVADTNNNRVVKFIVGRKS